MVGSDEDIDWRNWIRALQLPGYDALLFGEVNIELDLHLSHPKLLPVHERMLVIFIHASSRSSYSPIIIDKDTQYE